MNTRDELHAQVDELCFRNWHIYTILHAMIDTGQLTVLECHRPDCLVGDRSFSPDMGKHNRTAVALDHIVQRHLGGHHRLDNLRPVHRVCNWGWRAGITGSFHTEESRELIRQRAITQHASGRGPDYADTARNEKIAQGVRNYWQGRKTHG